MTEFMNVTFASGKLPENWDVEMAPAGFEGGAMLSGVVTRASFVAPGSGWGKMVV